VWEGTDGEAHATLYLDLAESQEQLDWHHTFVPGVGYKKFETLVHVDAT
jgi:hypothetical protein